MRRFAEGTAQKSVNGISDTLTLFQTSKHWLVDSHFESFEKMHFCIFVKLTC